MICDVGVWKSRLLGKVRWVGGDPTRIHEDGQRRLDRSMGWIEQEGKSKSRGV